ncbi:RHS repeat-associated core domain-containing protein [Actinoalloteichus hymeniacidonis]|uniref:RHS repeat-associated core domain-containing protein n=1 Tax=Actinoalloteichus hymeniacidonis TaxID=340345 RepID=UPI000852935F|nr:RHS repeat-associated core domain-containing protein [Actinoalloteichus hymeniacidonis]MBB5906806.1 RHS repeat-associated protein [Actinoalloteichus hymeniacidonis]
MNSTNQAIQNGDWLEAGLGTAGLVMSALDPFAAIISNGVGWLLEHVGPLSDALDSLAGSPDEIQSHADTWSNVANEVNAVSTELGNLIQSDVSTWTGAAADAYRERATDTANLILAAGAAAGGAAEGIQMAGEVVSAVRDAVRDIIADVVGSMVSWALQVLFTLGIGMVWVVPKVVAKVAETAAKIAQLIQKLVSSMSKLSPLLKKLGDDFADAGKHLKEIKTSKNADTRSTDAPPSITPSGNTGGGRSPDALPGTNNNSPGAGTPESSRGGPEIAPSGVRGGPGVSPSGARGGGGGNTRSLDSRFCESDPVDVVTGEMVLAQSDLTVDGWLPLVLDRTHLSSYRSGRLFGPSWSSTLDQRIEITPTGPRYHAADGMVLHYPVIAAGADGLPIEGPRIVLSHHADGGYSLALPESDRELIFAAATDASHLHPLRAIVDVSGHHIEVARDAAGLPTEVRHSAGYRVRVSNQGGRITGFHLVDENDGETEVARFDYDDVGRLAEVTNSSGAPMVFHYDGAGRITSWRDRTGVEYRYDYDGEGRCVRTSGTGGFVSGVFTYDSRARVSTYANALGATKTFRFDDAGRVESETDSLGNTTAYTWDTHDRLLTRTDPHGGVTTQTWDAAGDLVSVTHPDGTRTETVYTQRHRPLRRIEPDGAVHRWEYDSSGALRAEIEPTGATTSYAYEADQIIVTDALGGVTRTRFDNRGLVVATTDPAGSTTTFEYDAFARLTAGTEPTGETTRFGWTVEGLPAWETGPDGRTQTWSYDGEGNCVEHVDAQGRVTRSEYGPFGVLTARTGPDGTTSRFEHDAELRVTSVIRPDGRRWTYRYDAAGNLVQETDFNGSTVAYTHDALGRIVSRVNGMGERIDFVRDAAGRIVEETAGGVTTHYTHDPAGRLLRAANPDVELAYVYDESGRIATETCNGATTRFEYDELDRRVSRTTPTGVVSTWQHAADGLPSALRTAAHTVAFAYDASGREVHRGLGASASLAQTWEHGDRLRSQALTTAMLVNGVNRGSTVAQRRAWVYRGENEVIAVTDQLSGPREYELDVLGRAIGVQATGWRERYGYDDAGNLSVAEITAAGDAAAIPTETRLPARDTLGDRRHEGTLLTSAGSVRYDHDGQGRVVTRRLGHDAGEQVWRYEWDCFDRLVAVTTPSATRWRYRYDPHGRRISKERLDAAGQVAEQVRFGWDGDVLIEQVATTRTPDGAAAETATTWEWEPDGFRVLTQTERVAIGTPAARQWTDLSFHHVITDLIGTPLELVAPDGTVTWHGHSTLWGENLTGDPVGAIPLRFPGQYHDAETGLHYNRNRYYDPATGRYLTPDPLGLSPQLNHHEYVPNPITWSDPLGLKGKKKKKNKAGNQSGGQSVGQSGSRPATPVPQQSANPPPNTGGTGTCQSQSPSPKPTPAKPLTFAQLVGSGGGNQPATRPAVTPSMAGTATPRPPAAPAVTPQSTSTPAWKAPGPWGAGRPAITPDVTAARPAAPPPPVNAPADDGFQTVGGRRRPQARPPRDRLPDRIHHHAQYGEFRYGTATGGHMYSTAIDQPPPNNRYGSGAYGGRQDQTYDNGVTTMLQPKFDFPGNIGVQKYGESTMFPSHVGNSGVTNMANEAFRDSTSNNGMWTGGSTIPAGPGTTPKPIRITGPLDEAGNPTSSYWPVRG